MKPTIDQIMINGAMFDWEHDKPLTYEEICRLAGAPEIATVTYYHTSRQGFLHKGKSIKTEPNMKFGCMVTSDA